MCVYYGSMINFLNLVYIVIVIHYVIVIRNNQDKIKLSLEHIQNEIRDIKNNITKSLDVVSVNNTCFLKN